MSAVFNPFEGIEFPEDAPVIHVYESAAPGVFWVDTKEWQGSMTIQGTVCTFGPRSTDPKN